MSTVMKLVQAREETHGSFEGNSGAFAALVNAVPLENYHPKARYAVANIYNKLARMSSGKSMEREHWEDVEGYAHKVLEMIP